MTKNDIIQQAKNFIKNSPGNYITKEIALHPSCEGLKIFEAPILAFGAADDEIYTKYKEPDVIGSHFLSPTEWLPTAKTVISFFLPYTSTIKTANSKDNQWPADEWLHGRYEGQQLLVQLVEHLIEILSNAGFTSLAPSADPRLKMGSTDANNIFSSNWSERHIAYACGLGTFGISRGLITKKGIAGRFGSILTELDLPKDSREYSGIYDYCNMCGECISRCPAGAISYENMMKHELCSELLDTVHKKHNPRYGCGKCQTGVPCESEIPHQ